MLTDYFKSSSYLRKIRRPFKMLVFISREDSLLFKIAVCNRNCGKNMKNIQIIVCVKAVAI